MQIQMQTEVLRLFSNDFYTQLGGFELINYFNVYYLDADRRDYGRTPVYKSISDICLSSMARQRGIIF